MYETIFASANLLVMPFWFLMIFLPFWGWTTRIMRSLWTVVPLAVLYALLALPDAIALLGELSNPSVANIAALLGTPAGATIGWIHFLAFDLFVGRWAYLDSRQRGINGFLVSPTLFFVFMFGPLGLLLYLLVRAIVGQRATGTAQSA